MPISSLPLACLLLPVPLVFACYSEIRFRRIPNWLTLAMMAFGLGAGLLEGDWAGLLDALIGLAVGGGVFLPFCLMGALGGGGAAYVRIRVDYSREMKRGLEVRRVAVREDCTLKKMLSFLRRGKYTEFIVYDGEGGFLCELSEEDFVKMLENAPLYSPVSLQIHRQ